MGFRFRRSIRIMPGLRINLSKSGPSLSVGGHGATVNISKKGTRTTVGLPGTGISYQTTNSHARHHNGRLASTAANRQLPAANPRQSKGARAIGTGVLGLLVAGIVVWANSSPNSSSTGSQPAATPVASTLTTAASAQRSEVSSAASLPDANQVEQLQFSGQAEVSVIRTANLRSGPSVADKVIQVLKADNKLQVIGRSHGWVEVQDGDTSGWIAKSLVR